MVSPVVEEIRGILNYLPVSGEQETMAETVWRIITSVEVLVTFLLLLLVVILVDPFRKTVRSRRGRGGRRYREIRETAEAEKPQEPGRILVPDDTYELLMKDRNNR